MRKVRARLTYANVMSTIAAFLVLGGGTAVAAAQLAKDSVGPRQLKRSAVTAPKIKNSAVTTAKIKNNAVTRTKIRANAVTGDKVDEPTLGTVPSAAEATRARSATSADRAANADALGGIGPTGYVAAAQLLRFSAAIDEGDADVVLGGLGPLTFIASCDDAGAQTRASVTAKTSAGPILVNGVEVYPAGARELAVALSGDSGDYTAELVAAVGILEAFAANGAFTSIVRTTGADCRFVGHLLADAG